MAKNIFKGVMLLVFSQIFISCENEIQGTKRESKVQTIDDVKLVNGILQIDSKASLQNIIENYKMGVENQNQFNDKIRNLQNNGFLPLTPFFPDNDTEMVESFVKRKIERLKKRDAEYGIYSRNAENDEDIDLDDEIIFDPAFSSLLNEKREIIVGEKFYKYNEMGVFFCDTLNKESVDEYLDDLTAQERVAIINHDYGNFISPDPCTENPLARVALSMNDKVSLYQPAPTPPCIGWGGDGGSGSDNGSNPDPTPVALTYNPPSDLIKENLPICEVRSNNLWEMIFGPSEGCRYYMHNNDRRVKTKFWNQNYLIFSSIGAKVKWQKHEERGWASWWEKSYAEKLELGVNYLTYEYNFNVPAFNFGQYNFQTTFFEYNGTKFNSNGQIINTVPIGKGNFIFDTESEQSIFNITTIGQKITNSQINQVIDVLAKQGVNYLGNSFFKDDLILKLENDNIKFNVVVADPFSNKVQIITKDVKWVSNNEHNIVKYFDMNFKWTWKNSYNGVGDYLQGMTGSTAYTNVEADIYGAVLCIGNWGGHRMKFVKRKS